MIYRRLCSGYLYRVNPEKDATGLYFIEFTDEDTVEWKQVYMLPPSRSYETVTARLAGFAKEASLQPADEEAAMYRDPMAMPKEEKRGDKA